MSKFFRLGSNFRKTKSRPTSGRNSPDHTEAPTQLVPSDRPDDPNAPLNNQELIDIVREETRCTLDQAKHVLRVTVWDVESAVALRNKLAEADAMLEDEQEELRVQELDLYVSKFNEKLAIQQKMDKMAEVLRDEEEELKRQHRMIEIDRAEEVAFPENDVVKAVLSDGDDGFTKEMKKNGLRHVQGSGSEVFIKHTMLPPELDFSAFEQFSETEIASITTTTTTTTPPTTTQTTTITTTATPTSPSSSSASLTTTTTTTTQSTTSPTTRVSNKDSDAIAIVAPVSVTIDNFDVESSGVDSKTSKEQVKTGTQVDVELKVTPKLSSFESVSSISSDKRAKSCDDLSKPSLVDLTEHKFGDNLPKTLSRSSELLYATPTTFSNSMDDLRGIF